MKQDVLDLLKEKNLKVTSNRKIILEYIEERKDAFSAEDLYKKFLPEKNINLSTIYRTLNTFWENNLIQKAAEIDGVIYYQKLEEKHHHQLICTECKSFLPIEDCPITEWKDTLENKTGYEITSHHLEFRGICPDCQKKKKTL